VISYGCKSVYRSHIPDAYCNKGYFSIESTAKLVFFLQAQYELLFTVHIFLMIQFLKVLSNKYFYCTKSNIIKYQFQSEVYERENREAEVEKGEKGLLFSY